MLNAASRGKVNFKTGRKSGLLSLFLICLVFFLPAGFSAGDVHLPESILNMQKLKTFSGEKASGTVDRMHRGRVATGRDFIAKYKGSGYSATYYLSLYADPDKAREAMESMARVMEETEHEFTHLMPRTVKGKKVFMALGHGQAHYFFARDNELVWLAVDTEVAEAALEEVLMNY